MRYIKKLALYKNSPMTDRLSSLQDGRIVTNSVASLQVPTGDRSERPTTLIDGTIRYNTELKEFEVYNSFNPGPSPWEIIRTIRQATITAQNLGYGNYNDYIFGPLAYPVDTSRPQNILVFVDNVYQIPNTNYTLISNPAASTASIAFSTSTGVTRLYVSTLTNIDVGTGREISGTGIASGTTVTNVSFIWNNVFYGYPVDISLPTTGSLSEGDVLTISYDTGIYIEFTGPVPAKPVFSLLGFDGYFPAGPTGTAFEP